MPSEDGFAVCSIGMDADVLLKNDQIFFFVQVSSNCLSISNQSWFQEICLGGMEAWKTKMG